MYGRQRKSRSKVVDRRRLISCDLKSEHCGNRERSECTHNCPIHLFFLSLSCSMHSVSNCLFACNKMCKLHLCANVSKREQVAIRSETPKKNMFPFIYFNAKTKLLRFFMWARACVCALETEISIIVGDSPNRTTFMCQWKFTNAKFSSVVFANQFLLSHYHSQLLCRSVTTQRFSHFIRKKISFFLVSSHQRRSNLLSICATKSSKWHRMALSQSTIFTLESSVTRALIRNPFIYNTRSLSSI